MKKYFLLEETEEEEEEYPVELIWEDINYILDEYEFEYVDSSYSTEIFRYTTHDTNGSYTPDDYDSVEDFEEDCPDEVAYYLSAELAIDEYDPLNDCYLDIKLLVGNFPKQFEEQLVTWVTKNLSFNFVMEYPGEFEGRVKINILDSEELRDVTKLADKVYDTYKSILQFIDQRDIEFQNQLANINVFVSSYSRQVPRRTIIEIEGNETWIYDGSIYSLSTPSIIIGKWLNSYDYLIREGKFTGSPQISIKFYDGNEPVRFESFNKMFWYGYSIDEVRDDIESLSPMWASYIMTGRGNTIVVESKDDTTMNQEEFFKFFKEADAIVKYFEDNFTIQEI